MEKPEGFEMEYCSITFSLSMSLSLSLLFSQYSDHVRSIVMLCLLDQNVHASSEQPHVNCDEGTEFSWPDGG